MSVRYEIEGKRPGTTIHINGHIVRWHVSGGYPFSHEEVAALKKSGAKVVPYKPSPAKIKKDAASVARAAVQLGEQMAAAELQAQKADKVISKSDALKQSTTGG